MATRNTRNIAPNEARNSEPKNLLGATEPEILLSLALTRPDGRSQALIIGQGAAVDDGGNIILPSLLSSRDDDGKVTTTARWGLGKFRDRGPGSSVALAPAAVLALDDDGEVASPRSSIVEVIVKYGHKSNGEVTRTERIPVPYRADGKSPGKKGQRTLCNLPDVGGTQRRVVINPSLQPHADGDVRFLLRPGLDDDGRGGAYDPFSDGAADDGA